MLKSVVCSIVLFILSVVKAIDDIKYVVNDSDGGEYIVRASEYAVVSEQKIGEFTVTIEVKRTSILETVKTFEKGNLPGGMIVKFYSSGGKEVTGFASMTTGKGNRQVFRDAILLEESRHVTIRITITNEDYAIIISIDSGGGGSRSESVIITIGKFKEAAGKIQ